MERALLIFTLVSGLFCNQIRPKEEIMNIAEDEKESVKLSCSYESSSDYVELYWYREHPKQAPQFLVWKGARSRSGYVHSPHARFQSTTSRTSTELSITKPALADSALYYCALRVEGYLRGLGYTVGPQELIFGKPIKLTVTPNRQDTVPPVLSILSPSQSSNGPKVCLAARFRPIDGFMKLTLDGKEKEVELNPSSAVLSKEGLFYYAGFSEDNIQKCQMNDQEKNTYSKGNEGVSPTCEPTVNTTSNQTKEIIDKPKENTLSLIVTGLRLLLAKAVAVNVMITFKAFFV